jgi:hypothetical protein
MAETTYVYLQPEINQKWYITLAIAALIGGLLSIIIWAFKKYWEVNTCRLGPNIGSVFGLASKDWSEACINAPLEGTINEIKHKAKMEKEKAKIDKENAVKPLKTLLDKIQDNIKTMITRAKVATSELKASNRKF